MAALKTALDTPAGRSFLEELRDRASPTRGLARMEDALDGQEELLRSMQGDASDIRRRVKDLTAQVEEVRQQARDWRRSLAQDYRGVPKPAPADPENPTDEEIEREIVHQLYQKNCWGNKYGQYEKLKRGYNSKASDRQVRAAVRRLEERRWIVLYPKDTDQFRLNPAMASAIYRFLGVPDREADELAQDAQDDAGENDLLTQRDLTSALDGLASRFELDKHVTQLRNRMVALESRPVSIPIGAPDSARESEVKELKGMLRGLQGEVNRLKQLAEDLAAAQRRLEKTLTDKTIV